MNAMNGAPPVSPVKIKTRTTDDMPDILDSDLPLVKASVKLINRLRARELTPDGYQDWTFNPQGPLRRKLVDPTFGRNPDGLIIAKEVSVEDAYAKFGGRPLSDSR